MKLPAIHFNLEATVQSVTPDGDIQYQTVMNDATVAEEAEAGAVPLDQIKNAFASFKGLTGSGVISSRGLTKSAELKIPPGTEPQVASMMEQMRDTISHLVLPLPEEPVGVGARWELKMPTKSQGMNVTETASIEVVSIEDDKIVTKGQIGQTAANQKIDSPMMPGIPINVTKMNETGTREATLDLSRLLPVSATVNGHSESSMNMEMAGQKQEMEIKTEMSIKAEAK